MITKEEIEVGKFIWWGASRIDGGWSCPTLVTEVTEDYFTIVRLDNLEEEKISVTNIPEINKSKTNKMSLCTIEEARRFKDIQNIILTKKVSDQLEILTGYQKNIRALGIF